MVTPEGYYNASKGAASEVYFVKGLKIIELEQLSEYYHDPDVLGKALRGEKFPKRD